MAEAVEICVLISRRDNVLEVIAANTVMTPAVVAVVAMEVVTEEVIPAVTCATISRVDNAPEAVVASSLMVTVVVV